VQLLKDISIYGLGDFFSRFLAFLLFPLYTHIFTVYEYGIISLISTFAMLTNIFLGLGINNALQRFYFEKNVPIDYTRQLISSGFWFLLGWSSFVTALFIVGVYFGRDLLSTQYGIYFGALIIPLFTNIFNLIIVFASNITRLHFTPWKFATLNMCSNLTGLLIGLIFVAGFKWGIVGYFAGYLTGAVLSTPLSLFFIKKELHFKINKNYVKKITGYGYPFIFSDIAFWVFGSMDRWMLGTYTTAVEVGLYSVAFRFAMVIVFVNNAFGQAWSPFAIKQYETNSNYRPLFSSIFSYWFLFITGIALLISIFSKEILFVLLPPSYWAAAPVMPFILMGIVLQSTTQITAIGISITKKTHLFSYIAGGTALFNFGLNVVLIPKFGAQGAAIATFFSYGILTSAYLYFLQRLHPIPLEHKKLLFSVGVIVAGLAISLKLMILPVSVETVCIKIGICLFFLFLSFLFKVIEWQDIKPRIIILFKGTPS